MASAAQIKANRENAKSSTGPRTSQGKQKSSVNATKFGLFSTRNCVRHREQEEYDQLSASLWDELHPIGSIEGILAIEIVRCAWRLRRCAVAECDLAEWNRQEQHARLTREGDENPDRRPADPVILEFTALPQAAIDRARGQAQAGLRRAMSDLASRQTERMLRAQLLPADADPASLGLARVRDLLPGFATQSQREPPTAATDEPRAAEAVRESAQNEADSERDPHGAKGTESARPAIPRNAPCSCGSGLKYKRCCGVNAPAVLGMAA